MAKRHQGRWPWMPLLLGIAAAGLLFQLLAPTVRRYRARPRPGAQTSRTFVSDGQPATDYLLYLPQEYGQAARNWPLVLFLHGSGQRGDDLALVRQVGIPAQIDADRQFPFIVVSPQCRNERSWEPHRLLALLDHIEAEFAVDPDRIYVTGFELGGYGTWNLAAADPERFAAVAPICGFPQNKVSQEDVDWAKRLPIWAFRGTSDQTTWFSQVEELFDNLWSIGAPAKLTVFPETAEGQSWRAPYENPRLLAWLTSKRCQTALHSEWPNGCPSAGMQVAGQFCPTTGPASEAKRLALVYQIYLPEQYDKAAHPWPLLLFLHGGRQGGNAPETVNEAGPPKLIDQGVGFPFIVLSPRCPLGRAWEPKNLLLLLDHIQNEFRADPKRIYVSGTGHGGDATWKLAVAEPDRFAAIVPVDAIPGPEFRADAHYMKRMAIWACHGEDKAAAARFAYIKEMIEKLKQGGSAKLTSYSVKEDEPRDQFYRDPALAKWLLAQKQDHGEPRTAAWIGHVRGVFPPPRDVVRLFLPLVYRFTGGRYKEKAFRYHLFVPEPIEPGRRYPLIIWLHGHGWEELELEAGQLKYLELIFKDPENRARYPFFVLAPQCPRDRGWFDRHGEEDARQSHAVSDEPGEVVMKIVDELIEHYSVDPDRITAFGISSGASACWELAARYPDRFAAIAPTGSGGESVQNAKRLKGVRVWVFHSLFDDTTPIDGDRKMVTALRDCGGNVRFMEVPNGTHLCWYDAFDEYGLLPWLLQAKRQASRTSLVLWLGFAVGLAVTACLCAAMRKTRHPGRRSAAEP